VRPIGFGCQDHHHPHRLIVGGRPVGEPVVGLLTLWSCPELRALGGYWHDLRRDPLRDGVGGGPGLDALP
jgi:hypothetical protein